MQSGHAQKGNFHHDCSWCLASTSGFCGSQHIDMDVDSAITDIVLVDKGHFDVHLSKFRLAVGAKVFIAEAADNLGVAVKASHH